MALFQTSILLLGLITLSQSIFIPPSLTGPLPVGVVSYELNNTSTFPTRDLMVSIFYPALESEYQKHRLQPDLPLIFANNYSDSWLSLPPNASASVIQHAYNSPQISSSSFPVLFFSPGYGSGRLYYNGAAQNLASQGYIVVSLDHPNDTDFIVYPDGRTATFNESTDDRTATDVVLLRVSDTLFVLDHLSEDARENVPGLVGSLDTDRIGILGHSAGGSTAAQAMLNDTRFVAGINMDGPATKPVESAGLDRPFLLVGQQAHTLNSSFDPTWTAFYNNLRGWKRAMVVNQTIHHHFCDSLYFLEQLSADGYPEGKGYLNGTYMFGLESAYTVDFFDKWMKAGKGELFDGPSAQWPEVVFDG